MEEEELASQEQPVVRKRRRKAVHKELVDFDHFQDIKIEEEDPLSTQPSTVLQRNSSGFLEAAFKNEQPQWMQENDEVQFDCDPWETRMHSNECEFKEEKTSFEIEDPGSPQHSTSGCCDQVGDQSVRHKLPEVPSTKREIPHKMEFHVLEDGEFADSDSENDESDEDNDILDGLELSGDEDDDSDVNDPAYQEEQYTNTGSDENADSETEASGDKAKRSFHPRGGA
ncbi:uncharacterized protein [Macrobrachium rosenbergii]|uniref:uncharacterized protein n=1 Tax=Macrobrachium rosenbergii TaxID=79674 RepID=UPI0034D65D78